MNKKKRKPAHISQKDWDSVNSPALTRAWFKRVRHARGWQTRIDRALTAFVEVAK